MENVSFIIPHKGREEFLQKTIESILEQDYSSEKIEIIVVTQNKHLESLDQYSTKESTLTIEYQPSDLTISELRNRGASIANGQYLAFLDADIYLSPNWLSSLLNLLLQKESRLLVSAMQVNGENPPALERIRTTLSNADIDCNVNFLPGRNLLLSKKTFEQVGGFPEHLITCEDYYFTDKVNEIGELYYSSVATYVHLGEDKEYLAMYKKEIWRGQSNLQSIRGRNIPLREWPSFLIPIGLVGLFSIALLLLSLQQYAAANTAFLLALTPLLVYSGRLYLLARKQISIADILKFYALYFPARAIGTVLGMFKSISLTESK